MVGTVTRKNENGRTSASNEAAALATADGPAGSPGNVGFRCGPRRAKTLGGVRTDATGMPTNQG